MSEEEAVSKALDAGVTAVLKSRHGSNDEVCAEVLRMLRAGDADLRYAFDEFDIAMRAAIASYTQSHPTP